MSKLRQTLRDARAALPAATVAAHSRAIARRLWKEPYLARCRDIACYWAVDGEVDCTPFIEEAWSRGRRIWLPVIHGEALVFARWAPGVALVANRYGIAEPDAGAGICRRAHRIDVVLAPLVAVDARGTRLGMGGGFYDRSLRGLAYRGTWRRPRVIGLAHSLQQVAHLPRSAWDIPLDAVVTERSTHRFMKGDR